MNGAAVALGWSATPPGAPWKTALREGAITGTVAALLSTAVLTVAGRREAGSAVAPINAVSHWLWSDESLHAQEPSLRHTLTGFVTSHLAAIFWAMLYSRAYRRREEAKQ